MASPFDTSQADLVLLSQNLAKAKRTSDRLTGMLSTFDEKLVRLEKGVTNIHKSTGGLTRVGRSERTRLPRLRSFEQS
jgi:exocyst complex protein 7